jgi:[ribosomal protein S18]-alanine N-acetyltransferase
VSVVLRLMAESDVPAVAELERSVFGNEAWSADMLFSEMAAPTGTRHYLVAEDDGELAGYGGLLGPPGGPHADVVTLAVAADRWGRGIGTALLHGLLAEAAQRGCRDVFLEVRVDNDRAQRLYRRNGFAGVGIRRGYYQPSGTDALVMRRVMTTPHRRLARRAGAGGAA